MVGRINPLTLGELGQTLDLLSNYQSYLLYEHQNGAIEGEHPFDVEQREIAIERVQNCISTIAQDLQYRITNY